MQQTKPVKEGNGDYSKDDDDCDGDCEAFSDSSKLDELVIFLDLQFALLAWALDAFNEWLY